jgi:hypothetical protein
MSNQLQLFHKLNRLVQLQDNAGRGNAEGCLCELGKKKKKTRNKILSNRILVCSFRMLAFRPRTLVSLKVRNAQKPTFGGVRGPI